MITKGYDMKLIAYFRYGAWLVHWHIEGRWVIAPERKFGRYKKRWWWFERNWATMQPKYPPAFWVASMVKSIAKKVMGPYTHRSDYTDPQEGILHGGHGWSKKAFDDFNKRIEECPRP